MMRSNEEWAKHPQAHAVDSLPLIEIERIGDSPPEPFKEGDRPLSGVCALDLTRVIAGPMCGRTLAEHGADVMRVGGQHLPFIDSLVIDTGNGKLSTHLGLRNENERKTLRGLTRDADIFPQGYRPGSISGRGFSPEEIAAIRPGIAYVSVCACGRAGPWSEKRGYDSLVQCCTGMVDEHTGDEETPQKITGANAGLYYGISGGVWGHDRIGASGRARGKQFSAIISLPNSTLDKTAWPPFTRYWRHYHSNP
jgi:hypothetical protein